MLIRSIIEIAGIPKEHVEQTIKLVIDKLKEDYNDHVKSIKENPVEKHHDLFSGFIESEIEFQELKDIVSFCINYMPSSIEIVEPENLQIKNLDLTDMINNYMAVIHDIDYLLKNYIANYTLQEKNFNRMIKNFIYAEMYHKKQTTINQLEKEIGLPKADLLLHLYFMKKDKILDFDVDDKLRIWLDNLMVILKNKEKDASKYQEVYEYNMNELKKEIKNIKDITIKITDKSYDLIKSKFEGK